MDNRRVTWWGERGSRKASGALLDRQGALREPDHVEIAHRAPQAEMAHLSVPVKPRPDPATQSEFQAGRY